MTAKPEDFRNARSMTEVEDIRTFLNRKRTRATIARERGLEPRCARIIMAANTPDPLRSAERFTGQGHV